jgi:nucleoside-diphosphate kinase
MLANFLLSQPPSDAAVLLCRWVQEISSGMAYAVELVGDDAVATLRSQCGPYMPDVARSLQPDTIRAQFGVDNARNGVHCTDLARDGPLESKYMFHVV